MTFPKQSLALPMMTKDLASFEPPVVRRRLIRGVRRHRPGLLSCFDGRGLALFMPRSAALWQQLDVWRPGEPVCSRLGYASLRPRRVTSSLCVGLHFTGLCQRVNGATRQRVSKRRWSYIWGKIIYSSERRLSPVWYDPFHNRLCWRLPGWIEVHRDYFLWSGEQREFHPVPPPTYRQLRLRRLL